MCIVCEASAKLSELSLPLVARQEVVLDLQMLDLEIHKAEPNPANIRSHMETVRRLAPELLPILEPALHSYLYY